MGNGVGSCISSISIHALLAESDWGPDGTCRPDHPFLSTLSLRRATVLRRGPCHQRRHFYPRSPCGERHLLSRFMVISYNISIHALLAESDDLVSGELRINAISIHALLAESDIVCALSLGLTVLLFLSTLSLRRATKRLGYSELGIQFLSTLSLRRATVGVAQGSTAGDISIHALLAESDCPAAGERLTST